MKKSAFTMLELVFVIVVIGIISAMVIPRIDRDTLAEATNQVVSHIKYTQHLAMTEDMYNDGVQNWFDQAWQIEFYGCGGYSVFSDRNSGGGANQTEAAVDPQTKKYLFTTAVCTENNQNYERVILSNYYDIDSIGFTGCTGQDIAFDNMGRPYTSVAVAGGVVGTLMNQDCVITLTADNGDKSDITVTAETGYTFVSRYY